MDLGVQGAGPLGRARLAAGAGCGAGGRVPSAVVADTPLPEPESDQLSTLIGSQSMRLVYGLLHRRTGNPPTADEIRFLCKPPLPRIPSLSECLTA